jgi:uncharacterized protein YneF (UPF0154 family)
MVFFEVIGIIILLIIILFVGYLIGKYITKKHFEENYLKRCSGNCLSKPKIPEQNI